MFAMNPQTITMPEGVTPVASTTEPAGAAAAGTAFAEVMGPVPPPTAAGATQPLALILQTLAEPALTATLLAWPVQPPDSAPRNATDPQDIADLDEVWTMADAMVDTGVALEIPVPPLVAVDQMVLPEGATLPPATPVPAIPVENPAPGVSAGSQDQTVAHAVPPLAAAMTGPSHVAAAQPVLRPADDVAGWSGTAQLAPISPGPQPVPVAKPTPPADAKGPALRPQDGRRSERTAKGAEDVAPRLPLQPVGRNPAPTSGNADTPHFATGRGAVMLPVQTASQHLEPAQGPQPLAQVPGAALLGGAVPAPLHRIPPAVVEAPRPAAMAGDPTLAGTPVAAEVQVSVPKGDRQKASVNQGLPPVTARQPGDVAPDPTGTKVATTPPLAALRSPGQPPVVLDVAKAPPATDGIQQGRRDSEPRPRPTADAVAVKPTGSQANPARPTGAERPVQTPAPRVSPIPAAVRTVGSSVAGQLITPPNAPVADGEPVASETRLPPGRYMFAQDRPTQGNPHPGGAVKAAPVQWQPPQKTAQPGQTVAVAPVATVATVATVHIRPVPAASQVGLGSPVPPVPDQTLAQTAVEQPVPRPFRPGPSAKAAPVQTMPQTDRSGPVQKLPAPEIAPVPAPVPEPVSVILPAPDPVESGNKTTVQPATPHRVPDRLPPTPPEHKKAVSVASQRSVWFGERAIRTVPAGRSTAIDPAQFQPDAKAVIGSPAPALSKTVDPAQLRRVAPATGAVRSVDAVAGAPVPKAGDVPVVRAVLPAAPVPKTGNAPVPQAVLPVAPVQPAGDAPVVRGKPAAAPTADPAPKAAANGPVRADAVATPSAEPGPFPKFERARPVLPKPDTPVAADLATAFPDKPAARTAPPPVVAASVTGAGQPQTSTGAQPDLPTALPAIASFWQMPTSNLGWQTALQFWTPALPMTKPQARSAVPVSTAPVRASQAPLQMDLAAPFTVGKPLQVDDRPTPGPIKDRVEPDTPATPIPAPTVVPPAVPPVVSAAVPASGAAIAAHQGHADRLAAMADNALPPMPPTAPLNLSTPLNMPPHLPKGLPESLARAAKDERTELLLDPVELGKVRFELLTTGDKVQVNLSVERPETLDLLRRNMDSLTREFRDVGFDASTLTFSQWGKGQDDGQQPAQTPQFGGDADLPDIETAPTTTPTRNTASQGLDLRL